MTDVVVAADEVGEGERRRRQVLAASGLLEEPDDNEDGVLASVTRLTRRLLQADIATVSLVTGDRQLFRGQVGMTGAMAQHNETTIDRSFCRFVVAGGERLVVEDARVDPLVRESSAVAEDDVVAYAGEPLTTSAGDVLGTLCVISHRPREWSESELDTLAEMTRLVAAELEHRVRQHRWSELETLAGRLPEPVHRLGDAVRSTASLGRSPEDPRLGRMADLAKDRLGTVEALVEDIAASSAAAIPARTTSPVVDVRRALERAASVAGSGARAEDLRLDLGGSRGPVSVRWEGPDLDRALTLAMMSSLQHFAEPGAVTVRLEPGETEVGVRITSPGRAMPVGDLLRTAAAFTAPDGESARVAAHGRTTTVRRGPLAATTSGAGTELVLTLLREGRAPR